MVPTYTTHRPSDRHEARLSEAQGESSSSDQRKPRDASSSSGKPPARPCICLLCAHLSGSGIRGSCCEPAGPARAGDDSTSVEGCVSCYPRRCRESVLWASRRWTRVRRRIDSAKMPRWTEEPRSQELRRRSHDQEQKSVDPLTDHQPARIRAP